MIFGGNGIVKWKGKIIANFNYDGTFETNRPSVIQRLTMLGYGKPKEKFICDICSYESTTKAGVLSHKRFNHRDVPKESVQEEIQ
jgi:hypothetical protein